MHRGGCLLFKYRVRLKFSTWKSALPGFDENSPIKATLKQASVEFICDILNGG